MKLISARFEKNKNTVENLGNTLPLEIEVANHQKSLLLLA
jgi:hypothetical protein